MTHLKAFIAGFASTLVFHQGLLWLLYAGGVSPQAPWNMTPVLPLNALAVISLVPRLKKIHRGERRSRRKEKEIFSSALSQRSPRSLR